MSHHSANSSHRSSGVVHNVVKDNHCFACARQNRVLRCSEQQFNHDRSTTHEFTRKQSKTNNPVHDHRCSPDHRQEPYDAPAAPQVGQTLLHPRRRRQPNDRWLGTSKEFTATAISPWIHLSTISKESRGGGGRTDLHHRLESVQQQLDTLGEERHRERQQLQVPNRPPPRSRSAYRKKATTKRLFC